MGKPQADDRPTGAVDHTPATSATDDRPIRILERTPVPEEHRQRLFSVVRRAQAAAAGAGADLQAEFGRDHVGLIVACNQFTRLFRGGESPGAIELLVDEPTKVLLRDAGFRLEQPDGAVFRLFGWVRLNPMQGDLVALEGAVDAAFSKAQAAKKR